MSGYLERENGEGHGIMATQTYEVRFSIIEGSHVSSSMPRDSIFRARAQIRQPSPILSRNNRAVVTLGPTVREVLVEGPSSKGDEDRGVWSAFRSGLPVSDCGRDASECRCDRWKAWPQAKPMRISRSM